MDFFSRRPDFPAAAAITLLPFLLLGHALLPGRVLAPTDILLDYYPWKVLAPGVAPANPLMSDVVALFHPWTLYGATEIRHGRFPLWNPYVFTGAPFFANPQTALLFPLTVLAYVLPTAAAVTLMSILKLSAAGVAMYWFLRVRSIAVPAAFVAALTWMLSSPLIVWLQWSLSSTLIFLPLLLGVTERLHARADLRTVGGLALAVALALFAGYPQGAVAAVLVATAWTACRARDAVRPRRFAAGYALGVTLGVLLAAVQLIPFLEYLRASSVFAYRRAWIPDLHLPLRAAITFLLPYYYGSPGAGDFWGYLNFNLTTVAAGLVPWVALPVALLAGWRRVDTKFFLALALISGWMLYAGPGSSALLALPPFSWMLVINVAPPLIVFALAALCGIGLDAAAANGHGRAAQKAVRVCFVALVAIPLLFMLADYVTLARRNVTIRVVVHYLMFLALLTLATLLLQHWLRRGPPGARWGLALGAVALLSALPLAVAYNPVIDVRWFYPSTPAIEYLRRQVVVDHGRVLLGRNVAILYGLSDVAGYDGMTPHHLETVIGPIGPPGWFGAFGSERFVPDTVLASPVFDLVAIRYVVNGPGTPSPAPHFTLAYDGPDARVYRNESALPRAFLAARGRCMDDESALRRVWSRDVDFRQEVLLSACETAPRAGPPGAIAHAEISAYEPERVQVRATTDSAAYLILTDTWFPGWRVWVDGEEQRLWRADLAFRAVWLGPGQHDIVFQYQPSSLKLGLALSALAAGAVAGCFLAPRRASA